MDKASSAASLRGLSPRVRGNRRLVTYQHLCGTGLAAGGRRRGHHPYLHRATRPLLNAKGRTAGTAGLMSVEPCLAPGGRAGLRLPSWLYDYAPAIGNLHQQAVVFQQCHA